MKLLKEVTEQVKVKVLTEAEGSSGKKYFIEGIFITIFQIIIQSPISTPITIPTNPGSFQIFIN